MESRENSTVPCSNRQSELVALLHDLEAAGAGSPGNYSALAMMLADAALVADEATLAAARKGLERLYGQQLRVAADNLEALEQRGRLLSLIDVLEWLLRRVSPVTTLLPMVDSTGVAQRFLGAIEEHPGLTSQQLADALTTDRAEIGRIGAEMVGTGVARRRKLDQTDHWEITPRGRITLARVSARSSVRSALPPLPGAI